MSEITIEEKELLELLSIYYTARIDIKNYGQDSNSIEIVENSDPSSIIMYPKWFNKEQGTGITIQSKKLSLDLKIKCINNGELNLTFITLDTKDREGNRFPAYIDYTSIKINGVEQLKENKLIWHDELFVIKRKVKNNELITINIEWKPFTSSSLYTEKIIIDLRKQVEKLAEENKIQLEEIEYLENKNKKLKKKLRRIKEANVLEFMKMKKGF